MHPAWERFEYEGPADAVRCDECNHLFHPEHASLCRESGQVACESCEEAEHAHWKAYFGAYGSNARLMALNDTQLAEEMAEARRLKGDLNERH